MSAISFENVTKVFKNGTVAVDRLSLQIDDGEFMILVGPSGCGKTTALRMLAGLESVSHGNIRLGETVVNRVDPSKRDIAMVFQNYALFPHLTVFENIGFPLKMRGFNKAEITRQVNDVAAMLGLSSLLDRRPNMLSGGQRQRVAMGRAIIRHPQAFLMDEPLSNLDAKLRAQMRAELARLHRRLGVTTLYVTHDQTEAMTLGTKVAVMRNGELQQVGVPGELYRRPRNFFVATFIGSPSMNLLRARVDGSVLRLATGSDDPGLDLSPHWRHGNRDVVVGIRPESWRIVSTEASPSSADLFATSEIDVVEDLGSESMAYLSHDAVMSPFEDQVSGDAPLLIARLSATYALRPGDRIRLAAHLDGLHVFDGPSGDRLFGSEDIRRVSAELGPANEVTATAACESTVGLHSGS